MIYFEVLVDMKREIEKTRNIGLTEAYKRMDREEQITLTLGGDVLKERGNRRVRLSLGNETQQKANDLWRKFYGNIDAKKLYTALE